MIEALYSWVKHIIYYMIFLSAIGNLLADTKYEKYIRFFAGMVLILLVVSPFTKQVHLEEELAALFERISLQTEAGDLKEDLWGMEEKRLDQVVERYEKAVEEDLMRLAQAEGMECAAASVSVERDKKSSRYGQINSVYMELIPSGEETSPEEGFAKSKPVNVEAGRIDSVQVEQVAVGQSAEEEKHSGNKEGEEEQEIMNLKRKVEQWYELEASHIEIQWKDD